MSQTDIPLNFLFLNPICDLGFFLLSSISPTWYLPLIDLYDLCHTVDCNYPFKKHQKWWIGALLWRWECMQQLIIMRSWNIISQAYHTQARDQYDLPIFIILMTSLIYAKISHLYLHFVVIAQIILKVIYTPHAHVSTPQTPQKLLDRLLWNFTGGQTGAIFRKCY